MSRFIRLPLAEDTTADFCGSCPGLDYNFCDFFVEELVVSPASGRALRDPKCIDAEREASEPVP